VTRVRGSLLRLVALATILLTACACYAANITATPLGSNEEALVTVVGSLDQSDIDHFRTVTSSLSKAIVAFESPGGSLLAGIEIGTQIRLKGFATLVSNGSICASACGIAWLGGVKRLMGPTAKVGFHAAYVVKDGVQTETSAGNALAGAYFNRIGLPDRAIIYLTQAAPEDIKFLNFSEAAALGIDVESFTSPVPTRAATSSPHEEPRSEQGVRQPEPTALPRVSSGSRFAANDCGSITDERTGLDWAIGPTRTIGWTEAFAWASQLQMCDKVWALPTTAELKGLFDLNRSAGEGYLTQGKRWPAHIDPIFDAIGDGSWLWTRMKRGNAGVAVNMNQDIEVRLPLEGYHGTVRVFAVARNRPSEPNNSLSQAAASASSSEGDQSLINAQCSSRANALGLHGVARVNYRAQCKAQSLPPAE
jgi:hypothetical protein